MRQVRQQLKTSELPSAQTMMPSQPNPLSSSSEKSSFAAQLATERSQINSLAGMRNQAYQGHSMNALEGIHQVPSSQLSSLPTALPASDKVDFQQMFGNAINQVNRSQMQAGDLTTRFTQGDPNVDLPEVMVALQKSSVSFQAMTQVRNKLLDAYKEIMNMSI